MSSGPAGRQRDGSRDEILDAAAQLFTEGGFAATSTRAIALAVGIKQASLYYYFPSKDEILAELLHGTVQPSLAVAAALDGADTDPAVRLYALASFDVRLLRSGRWNLGALYLLPEIRSPRFTAFRSDRNRLRDAYRGMVADVVHDGPVAPADPTLSDLVFALVESVIPARSEGRHPDLDRLVEGIPGGCLRLLSVPAPDIAAARDRARSLLDELVPGVEPPAP